VIACADAALSLPANDNGGLAFRLDDDAPYSDDRAFAVEVVDRNASTLAPAIAAGVPSLWRAQHCTSPRSVVTLRLAQPYSRNLTAAVPREKSSAPPISVVKRQQPEPQQARALHHARQAMPAG
jgi:hypothetical protein